MVHHDSWLGCPVTHTHLQGCLYLEHHLSKGELSFIQKTECFCSTDQEIKGTILLVVQSDMCCKMPNIEKHLGTHGLWISIPLVSQGNIHVPNGSRSPSISTALKFLAIPGALRGKNGSNMVQMRMKWMKHPKNCISRRTMIDKPYVSGGAGGTVPSIGKPSRFSHGKGLFCSSFGTSKIGANK